MKTRGVSFNLDDPAQKELHDYTLSFKNFSAYVKALLIADKAIRFPSGFPSPAKKPNVKMGGITIKVSDKLL